MSVVHLDPGSSPKVQWTEVPAGARALVGPDAGEWEELRDVALGVEPWQQAPGHTCSIDGDAYRWCSRLPAGGMVLCSCGRPIFIPPETCLEYLEDEAASSVVDYSDWRSSTERA